MRSYPSDKKERGGERTQEEKEGVDQEGLQGKGEQVTWNVGESRETSQKKEQDAKHKI